MSTDIYSVTISFITLCGIEGTRILHTHRRHAKRKSDRSSGRRANKPNFGGVIRTRRRALDLTQAEVASLIKTSRSYVGYLESGKRHPSNPIVTRLAKALRLDNRELFFLANPHAEASTSAQPNGAEGSASVWDEFRKDKQLQQIHNVSEAEMKMLSQMAGCNFAGIRSLRDLIFILNTIRRAVEKTDLWKP